MDIDTLFSTILSQYGQRIDPETLRYLQETYQMGDREVAVSSLVGTLVEAGYDEEQLLRGPIGQLTQALGEDDIGSVSADPSAIHADPNNRPDPFAPPGTPPDTTTSEQPTLPPVGGQVIQPQVQLPPAQPQPQDQSMQPLPPQTPGEGNGDDSMTINLH